MIKLPALLALCPPLLLASCAPSLQRSAPPVQESVYATKAVYQPQQRRYQAAPAGFSPLYTELVARHGSRTMSSNKDALLALQLCHKAKELGALTPLGEQYGQELQRVADASQAIGYGNLTALGAQEQQALATRLAGRMQPLFSQAAQTGWPVSVLNSGKDRAVDSSVLFANQLKSVVPGLNVQAPIKNPDLLYFHKVDANKAYQDYLKNDKRLNTVLDEIQNQPKTHNLARAALLRLFSPAFVDGLTKGQYTFKLEDGSAINNEVDAVMNLYAVYSSVPALQKNGTFNFGPYLEHDTALWLAYLSDAEDFYQKGPSFKGQDITYKMAQVLEDDFFNSLEDVAVGKRKEAARLRFTHAEIIIPLAALMELPGSEKPADPDQPYRYQNNPWRGAAVSPMAANIQWDAYRNASGQVLVRMLYNERETRFKAACHSLTPNSFFYDLNELRRCYAKR